MSRNTFAAVATTYLLLLGLCLVVDCHRSWHENDINQNDVEERIQLGEPLKSLVHASARFFLAQTKLPNFVNIETAIDFINNIGYMLSKPSTLIKLIEAAAITIVGILGATFFFPSFLVFLQSAWYRPLETFNLDKYLSNGISERSVMGVIGSTTDEALARVGLHDGNCRERSICYVGEVIKCTFPETSERMAKFASDNFPNSSYGENKYFKAFTTGFVDRNCTKLAGPSSEHGESKNCLGSFFGTMLNPRNLPNNNVVDNGTTSSPAKKYQKMQPNSARA